MRARTGAMMLLSLLLGAGAARADATVSWDWILGGKSLPATPPAVDYLDLDAFDATKSIVAAARQNGTTTICYVSAGTLEDWRPDRRAFQKLDRRQRKAGKPAIIGKRYPDWPDERWLNFARYKVFLPLMVGRLERCQRKGFDMVEFDNIDAYNNRTGFKIRKRHAIRYAKALAAKARTLGMGSVHKNTPELTGKLLPYFNALLLEECVLFDFCDAAEPYRGAGKPVFNAEYPQIWSDEGKPFDLDTVCATAALHDISLIVKKLNLNTWVKYCP